MDLLQAALVAAVLLCALTAGFLFAFTVVVMPGIQSLPDGDFLRAFRAMDSVIQENDPRFLLVWGGSVVTLLAVVLLTVGSFTGADRWLLVVAAAAWVLCVQVPTIVVNVPLNDRLQALDLDVLDPASLQAAREAFETRWIRWNSFRTAFAGLTTLALLVLLLRF